MKIQTSITPRRDGNIVVTTPAGTRLVFMPDECGDLACDVTDEAAIAWLLTNENFYPSDAADYQAVIDITRKGANDQIDGGDADDGEFEEGVDEGSMSAAPVEGAAAADAAAAAPARAPRARRAN